MKQKIFQTPEQEINNGIFSVLKKDFFSIPVSIRIISISMFLFILGWGLGADAFFSIYIKSIVENIFLISIIGALMPLSKMLFSLPIGELDDHTNMKSVLFLSKIMYVIAGLLYFLVGVYHSSALLVVAVIFNGFASAALFTTYESYIRLVENKDNGVSSWGLYFSSLNTAYVIGAIISALMIPFIELHYVFLFISLFSIISLITDRKIPLLKRGHIKSLFAKESFLHQFIREVFSLGSLKRTFVTIKGFSKSMYKAMGFELLFNVLNYIGFIFIPLVAAANNLGLGKIALIFAFMRLPYMTNFFTAEWSQRFDKKMFMVIILLFLSFLFASLGFADSFGSIVLISFAISFGLSMMRPVISGLVSDNAKLKDVGKITGVQQFVAMLGDVVGILGFGFVSGLIGLQQTFLIIGILIFVLACLGIVKKMKKNK